MARHDERFKTQMELLKQKHDFTVDEYLSDDSDKIDYPGRQGRSRRAAAQEGQVRPALLEGRRRRRRCRGGQEVDDSLSRPQPPGPPDRFERAASSLSDQPHQDLRSPLRLPGAQGSGRTCSIRQLHLSLEGIGAQLRSEDGYAVVTEIVPGMAADKDGRLQPEDKIIGIEKDGETIDLVEKKLNDVVRYIRGPRGTKVRLDRSARWNQGKTRLRADPRRRSSSRNSTPRARSSRPRPSDGKELKIGVISLPAFYGDTGAILRGDQDAVSATSDCRKILTEYQSQRRRRGRRRPPRQRRRPARRSQDPLRTLHRHRPGRPGQGSLRRQASRRRRRRHRLGWPARRPDRQVQRQCVRDLRRRDPRLRPRPDHRRLEHVR